MSYPTPMDVAEAEDRDNWRNAYQQLAESTERLVNGASR